MMIEEMLFIFNSFEGAAIIIHRGLIAIKSPNISGKSKILDATALLMGWGAEELRASGLEHLVKRGAPWAQGSLKIVNSGERIEIRRRVKPDGKIPHRVNDRSLPVDKAIGILRSSGSAERYALVSREEVESSIERINSEREEILRDTLRKLSDAFNSWISLLFCWEWGAPAPGTRSSSSVESGVR
jgi:chromosome segregation protein